MDLSTAPARRMLSRGINHFSFAPHPALRHCVAYYNITFPAGGCPLVQPGPLPPLHLLPDASGCLVFSGRGGHKALFWGATTHTATVEQDHNTAPTRFFIEFTPGGAHRLTGLYMQELANRHFPVEDVCPALYKNLQTLLDETQNIALLLQQVDALLLAQLHQTQTTARAAVPLAYLQLLSGFSTTSPIKSLSRATGYSQRHLSRMFSASLGISAKACHRVLRINQVLQGIKPGVHLTALAHSCGYYDQAHFNHEFKAVCGVSPRAYLASMASFYKDNHKF